MTEYYTGSLTPTGGSSSGGNKTNKNSNGLEVSEADMLNLTDSIGYRVYTSDNQTISEKII